MIKKVGVVLVMAVLFLVLSVGAFAFQNEPEGFRGLEWGDAPTEEMEHYSSSKKGTDYYILPDDEMAIGNVKLYLIGYMFYEGQFLGVGLYFRGEDNYDLMKTICEQRYGEDEMDEGFYTTAWYGQKGFALLNYDYTEEGGFLTLGSTTLMMRKLTAEKEREAEKAAGDF